MQKPETWSAIAEGYAGAGKLFDVFHERALSTVGELSGQASHSISAVARGVQTVGARSSRAQTTPSSSLRAFVVPTRSGIERTLRWLGESVDPPTLAPARDPPFS